MWLNFLGRQTPHRDAVVAMPRGNATWQSSDMVAKVCRRVVLARAFPRRRVRSILQLLIDDDEDGRTAPPSTAIVINRCASGRNAVMKTGIYLPFSHTTLKYASTEKKISSFSKYSRASMTRTLMARLPRLFRSRS